MNGGAGPGSQIPQIGQNGIDFSVYPRFLSKFSFSVKLFTPVTNETVVEVSRWLWLVDINLLGKVGVKKGNIA